MKYRKDLKFGNELSCLGFGCMRFPRNPVLIDKVKSESLILKAIESGINYFDTAYLYMGSEEVLGEILEKHSLRVKVNIATKLPLMKCRKYEDFDRLFNEQREHLKTQYIDYYLMHNLCDLAQWERLRGIGIEKWLEEKKNTGEIRRIGFSFHGKQGEFTRILDAYPWDFCQIQYNYVNTHYQAGTAGLKEAAKRGLPVIIMEPLLGGKLSTGLPKKAVELFEKADKNATPTTWALKWLWNQPEVTVVLSGMNSLNQLEENVKTASDCKENFFTALRTVSVAEHVKRNALKTYPLLTLSRK